MALKRVSFLEAHDLFARSTSGWSFQPVPDGFGNAPIQLVETPAGQPRYNYNPATGEAEGVLSEPGRTRLNTIAAAPTAPETVTVTGAAHTISFFGTGTLGLTGASVQTIVGEGAFPVRTVVTFTPTAGALTVTPSGDVQHLQLELGATVTTPILGEGATVTRTGDKVSRTLGAEFNPNEGTLFFEFEAPDAISGTTAPFLTIGNGATISADREVIQLQVRDTGFFHLLIATNTGGINFPSTGIPFIPGVYRAAITYRKGLTPAENKAVLHMAGGSVFEIANIKLSDLRFLSLGSSETLASFPSTATKFSQFLYRPIADESKANGWTGA